MFKRSLLSATRLAAATVLGLSSVAALPAIAATDFRGGGFVAEFSGCEAYGWNGVNRVFMRVRPAGLAGNSGTVTRISISFGTGMHIYHFEGEPDGEWGPVDNWSVFTAVSEFTNGEVTARFLPGSTMVVDETTQQIVASVEVNGFDGLAGCSALIVGVVNKDE